MKILIATAFSGSWPYIPEMLEEFGKRSVDANVFDIDDAGTPQLLDRVAFRFPRLRPSVTAAMLRRRLAGMAADYDGVNIHFAAPIYAKLAKSLQRRGGRLVTSIWGSDFLRAGPDAQRALGCTFAASDIVTTNNPEVRRKLVERYPEIADRTRIVPFGIRSLDVIAQLLKSETKAESLSRLGIPGGKIVVAFGYNGVKEQRHQMMISAAAALSRAAKERLFLLVPMTYPDDPAYQDEVAHGLDAAGVQYRLLRGMQSVEDVCRLRIVSDYAVNVQTTDSLSASIQEHMFAGSTMIVSKWLPYGLFEEMGVPIHRVEGVQEISALLERAEAKGDIAAVAPAYVKRIYDYSSWSATADKWLDLFRT